MGQIFNCPYFATSFDTLLRLKFMICFRHIESLVISFGIFCVPLYVYNFYSCDALVGCSMIIS